LSAYVQIIVPQQLTPTEFKLWYDCVEQNTPSGLTVSTSLSTGAHSTQSKFYSKKTANNKHAYVIPLARDLDQSELHAVLKAWCAAYTQGDFLLDYSQHTGIQAPSTSVTQQRLDQILDAWGKQQHAKWTQAQVDKGWRYGVTMSTKHKTHPWLMPWESLPAQARAHNLTAMQDLFQVLEQFGMTLAQKPQA
jgi:hypothetical protein